MVTNTVEELIFDQTLGPASNPKLLRLQLEAQRANHDLIQLLNLYKHANDKLTPNITENNLEELIEDIAVENRALALAQGIRIDTQCDGMLFAFFDENLVRGVVNSAVGNAQRYTRDRILLSADELDGYKVIRVEDNGDGFPESMIELQQATDSPENFDYGRTRLGLYFAKLVAEIHTNRDQKGFIRLGNRTHLSGGCFSLWLP